MYACALSKAPHTKRFSITDTGRAWVIIEEEDSAVVRRVVYDDWHRVERARKLFVRTVATLRQNGWTDTNLLREPVS